MKLINTALLLLLISITAYSFTDESHYSNVFDTTRFFRVFTPLGYDAGDITKTYSVIYYFHGCGGSYKKSGPYTYQEFGLAQPVALNRKDSPDYKFPNNAEFENEASRNDVIIVCVDGKIPGIPGCGVYFPSHVDGWSGKYYNFSVYIRELFDVVDSRYNTKRGARHRAVSGLSMGGQMAVWVAATNPHLFSSASEFCHSPSFNDIGEELCLTTIDVQQLWRNLRGLPFRHSTNDRDYLRYYTTQLYETFSGAGFENEYYLADYCMHHAARIDLQFDFHKYHFSNVKEIIDCFSHINLYPNFEVWGYNVSSAKRGNGWIYLHDVTKNGLGIYTRERLPWAKSLNEFDISVTTAPIYIPNKVYSLSRYSYSCDSFSRQIVVADDEGKIEFGSSGGMGEEIGILGDELQAPVMVLTDTINENIYLSENITNSYSFDVVNLSASAVTINFTVTTENEDLLTIIDQPKQVSIPALSKISIDSLVECRGKYLADYKNTGYIKIGSVIDGVVQNREQIIQVVVKKPSPDPEIFETKIFDGKTEDLSLYKYKWGKWDNPLSSGVITEGKGNGNGKAEIGEVFSIWIQTPSSFEKSDTATWHPVVPVYGNVNPDVEIKEIRTILMNTGRNILSAQMQLNRKPSENNPVKIPIQVEFLKVQYLENSCHRNAADNFEYSYYDLVMYGDGSVRVDKTYK